MNFDLTWMAWTWPTAAFFATILLLLCGMAAWEYASPGGHPWAGVARCEVSASLPLPRAVELADLTAAHLPRFASKPFWDSRSPQNLVPIAALERRLWHLQGDRQIVLRRIRSAVARAPEYTRA